MQDVAYGEAPLGRAEHEWFEELAQRLPVGRLEVVTGGTRLQDGRGEGAYRCTEADVELPVAVQADAIENATPAAHADTDAPLA